MTEPIRRRWGAPLLGMMLLSATVVPLAHAESEVLTAEMALEAGHSADCPVLHVEARCLTGGSASVGAPSDVHALLLDTDGVPLRPTSTALVNHITATHTNESRAPPTC